MGYTKESKHFTKTSGPSEPPKQASGTPKVDAPAYDPQDTDLPMHPEDREWSQSELTARLNDFARSVESAIQTFRDAHTLNAHEPISEFGRSTKPVPDSGHMFTAKPTTGKPSSGDENAGEAPHINGKPVRPR